MRRSVIYLGSQPVGGRAGLWAFKKPVRCPSLLPSTGEKTVLRMLSSLPGVIWAGIAELGLDLGL